MIPYDPFKKIDFDLNYSNSLVNILVRRDFDLIKLRLVTLVVFENVLINADANYTMPNGKCDVLKMEDTNITISNVFFRELSIMHLT